MSEKKLHIVSFDNPYPPKYGGIIDVFYKIKALYECGIEVYLHCFVDEIPTEFTELQKYSKEIYFYKNKKNILNFLSLIPFSIKYRCDSNLIQNISKVNAPILLENIKTSYHFRKNNKSENIFMRMQNIESEYFNGISRSESNLLLKLLYKIESFKYHLYEKKLKKFNFKNIITLSKNDEEHIRNQYIECSYIPLFSGNNKLENLSEFGNYAIYSGDMKTADNRKSLLLLLDVFKEINDYQFVIAVSDKVEFLTKKASNYPNIKIIKIVDFNHLKSLYADSHIAINYSFQQSGTKLKLVNSLYNGRHCIINDNIVDDPEIVQICSIANSKEEIKDSILKLITTPYIDFEARKLVLNKVFNDTENAKKIIDLILK